MKSPWTGKEIDELVSERAARILANAFAFVMTFLMLWFIATETNTDNASETGHVDWTQYVYVYSVDSGGDWHRRVAKIKAISNATATMCLETRKHRDVSCFYTDTDGTSGLLTVQLVGEVKT